MTSLAGTVT